jgi:transcriptional regulator NrdR family protein
MAINPTDDCVLLIMEETLLAKEIIYVSVASHFKSFMDIEDI